MHARIVRALGVMCECLDHPFALSVPRFFRCGQRMESLGLECTIPLWFCLAFPNHVLDTAVDQATMM